jgi:hypothetical protein
MAKNKEKALLNEAKAKEVVDKVTHATSWRQPLKEKWDRFYKAYRSYLDERSYPWQSNLFIPYAFSTIETIAPRMVANNPQIDVMPREPNDEQYAKIMGQLVDYQWEEMDAQSVLNDAVKECLIYGTAILKVYWETEEADVIEKVEVDPTMPELGVVEATEKKTLYDAPKVELVDLYDFIWDPKGVDMESCRWVAHKSHRTLQYLQDMAAKGKYKNIHLLENETAIRMDDDKSSRRNTQGVGVYDDITRDEDGKRYIEVLEYWEDDRVVTVANRSVIIRDEKNPFRHGKKPFVRLVDQAIPHEFAGIGEIEPVETLIYELNSRRNQRMDNITLALNRMWKVKNGSGVDEDELVSDAGGVIHLDDMNGLEPLVMPDVTGSSYQEETLIKADIQQTTGVSDFTRGTGSDALANDTATGISLIQEAGNSRFRLKIRNMEMAIKDIGRMMVSMNDQYITDDKVIRIMGDEGAEWATIKPADMRSYFDVRVEAGTTLQQNDAVVRKQIMEMYQLFAGDPTVDQRELKKMVLEKAFQIKNTDKLLPADQGMPGMMPGMEGMEPPMQEESGGLTQAGQLQSVAPSQPQL